MTRRGNLKQKRNEDLNIEKVMDDFEKVEKLPLHRKGTFKIDKPFEQALETIIKADPKLRNHKSKAK